MYGSGGDGQSEEVTPLVARVVVPTHEKNLSNFSLRANQDDYDRHTASGQSLMRESISLFGFKRVYIESDPLCMYVHAALKQQCRPSYQT